jgi:hypothetical protein
MMRLSLFSRKVVRLSNAIMSNAFKYLSVTGMPQFANPYSLIMRERSYCLCFQNTLTDAVATFLVSISL